MGKIQQFEDLKVWMKARVFAKKLFDLSGSGELKNDYALKDQINRSAGSIMDNIAEGFERGGKKEFIQFLYIAKGSAGELRSQIQRGFDRGYFSEAMSKELILDLVEISKMISGLISYLKSTNLRGQKYLEESELSYSINELDLELDSQNY